MGITKLDRLQEENKILREKLVFMSQQYTALKNVISDLTRSNTSMYIAYTNVMNSVAYNNSKKL